MAQVKQAVVIVHGMGEQRPLDTLNRFIKAAVTPRTDRQQTYYSQPDRVTDSFESRRYLAPRYAPGGVEAHAQTEFYEYHWAHLMQGNELGDLWPTFRRMLLRPPHRVPAGLRFVWTLFWTLLLVAAWAFAWGPWRGVGLDGDWLATLVRTALGGGAVATVLLYLLTRVLPGALTNSFVDVVRYLDTSPRSYEVRRQIRKGMVDLLVGLHENGRYDRIVVVAHSLGAYIAYDGIAYLWAHLGKIGGGVPDAPGEPAGLEKVERLASDLPVTPSPAAVEAFQAAQRDLWTGLRAQGIPWLVTDFVSVGTPMYFADDLYARSRAEFDERVARWEFPTCPPQAEGAIWNNERGTRLWFSWESHGRRVLYHGAPFAAVRWTNLWFPARFGVFGDWFGGPLAPVFGPGVKDVPLTGNGWRQRVPAVAHTRYFSFPGDRGPASVTTALQRAMALDATAWLDPVVAPPEPPEPPAPPAGPPADPPARKAAAKRKAAPRVTRSSRRTAPPA